MNTFAANCVNCINNIVYCGSFTQLRIEVLHHALCALQCEYSEKGMAALCRLWDLEAASIQNSVSTFRQRQAKPVQGEAMQALSWGRSLSLLCLQALVNH